MASYNHQLRGTFLVALSGMLYGVMAYFGTNLFHEHLSVENMLFWRFFMAMLWMIAAILIALPSCKASIMLRNSPIELIKVTLFGAISYSGSSVFYFMASKSIGTGLAMVVFFAYPVFVALLAWTFSHWKMNKIAFASLIAVVIGLLLLKGQGETVLDITGIFLAVVAAIFYAIYVYGSQFNAKQLDSRLLTLLICSGNAFVFFIISCYTKTFTLPVTLNAWVNIFAIGIIATALPIQLLLDGLKYISSVKASILSVLEPVVTVLVGLLLLNETMSWLQVMGVLTVLIGAILIQFEQKLS